MSKLKFLLPLALFLGLAAFLYVGLDRDPHEIPSPLINKPAPAFNGASLTHPEEVIGTTTFQGKVWVLNTWASWCVPCRQEHPLITQLSVLNLVPVIGLNYKDKPAAANAWLSDLGNPYANVIQDSDGKIGIDWGVYGVPETFLIDAKGIIRYKHTGPLTEEVLHNELIPMIKKSL